MIQRLKETSAGSSELQNITMKVKQSSKDGSFDSGVHRGEEKFLMLKQGVDISTIVVASESFSAAQNMDGQKILTSEKLTNIPEIYKSYVTENCWPT